MSGSLCGHLSGHCSYCSRVCIQTSTCGHLSLLKNPTTTTATSFEEGCQETRIQISFFYYHSRHRGDSMSQVRRRVNSCESNAATPDRIVMMPFKLLYVCARVAKHEKERDVCVRDRKRRKGLKNVSGPWSPTRKRHDRFQKKKRI